MKILIPLLMFLGCITICEGTLRQRRPNESIQAPQEFHNEQVISRQDRELEKICNCLPRMFGAVLTCLATRGTTPCAFYVFGRRCMTMDELLSVWAGLCCGDTSELREIHAQRSDPSIAAFVELSLVCEAMACVGCGVCTLCLIASAIQELREVHKNTSTPPSAINQLEETTIQEATISSLTNEQENMRALSVICGQAIQRQIPQEEIIKALEECISKGFSPSQSLNFLREKFGLGNAHRVMRMN